MAGTLISRMVVTVALGLAGLVGACAPTISDAEIEKDPATIKDVKKAVEKPASGVLLIDARQRSEWEAQRIPGSINLGITQVSGRDGQRDPRLEKFAQIIVFGENPGSSAARVLAKKMLATGYKDVKFYPGGLLEWTSSNQPVRTGAPGSGVGEKGIGEK